MLHIMTKDSPSVRFCNTILGLEGIDAKATIFLEYVNIDP